MKQTINALYEKGVFRPLENLAISEGTQVRLTVETSMDEPQSCPIASTDLLELAARVYQGLSEEEIDAIEQIILNR
ncbi:MAG: antitoxin family protein [Hormoscilla sp.]